jgi:hypothetical protein
MDGADMMQESDGVEGDRKINEAALDRLPADVLLATMQHVGLTARAVCSFSRVCHAIHTASAALWQELAHGEAARGCDARVRVRDQWCAAMDAIDVIARPGGSNRPDPPMVTAARMVVSSGPVECTVSRASPASSLAGTSDRGVDHESFLSAVAHMRRLPPLDVWDWLHTGAACLQPVGCLAALAALQDEADWPMLRPPAADGDHLRASTPRANVALEAWRASPADAPALDVLLPALKASVAVRWSTWSSLRCAPLEAPPARCVTPS